ncbi:MAG: polysaccharide biosynthesis protein, partial [Rhodococcus sp. (in: high G+C Gram-positive bacteria)]
SQVQLVIVALSSVDLLLARRVLDPDSAGIYALGAVAAKAAFWLPQSVGVVLYPKMADPRQSASAVRTAIMVLLGVGGIVVSIAAVAGPLVPVVMGEQYAPVQHLLWLFAGQGALLAVVQLGLLASVARGDTRSALIAWSVLAVETVLVLVLVHSVLELIIVAAACAVAASVVVSASAIRGARVLGSKNE